MYTFVRALAVEFGSNMRWKEVDISTTPASALLTQYRQVFVVLNNAAVMGEMTLNLEDISGDLQKVPGTISDYLTAIGNKALPTTMGEPQITRFHATFGDVLHAGFTFDSTDMAVGDASGLPQESRPDVVIKAIDSSDGYDYVHLRNRVLACVNGFYHWTAADNRGYYVVGGNKTRLKSGNNYVGMLSFGSWGDLEMYQIDATMLGFEIDDTTGLVSRVHLKFMNCDLCQKTPILFLGGYMLLPDNDNLLLTNSNILTFKTHKYPFIERYFESKDNLDFSAFDLQHNNNEDDWIMPSKFQTQAFLTGYFTMSQSFLVLVDSQNLLVDRQDVETQSVPHTFISYERPRWPLVTSEGKHEVYWTIEEAGQWVLRCNDSYRRNYMFHTSSIKDRVAIDAAQFMGDAGYYGGAYLLKITDERIQIVTS